MTAAGARRERLVSLLTERSFRTGRFTLASGRESPYYVDARATTMSAEGLELIGSLGREAIRAAGWDADLVGGLTLGADPVAYAIALASRAHPPVIDAFTVRKDAKRHGTGRRVEGPFRPDARIVIVEDVITTGGSALTAVEAVREAGAEVLGVLAVVDRAEGGMDRLEATGLTVTALVTLPELVARGAG